MRAVLLKRRLVWGMETIFSAPPVLLTEPERMLVGRFVG
jgi:hypothetical protein